MSKKKGLFLTFEGPEASGKSSQIILLEKYLKKNQISFITTREPGEIPIDKIRNKQTNKIIVSLVKEEIFLVKRAIVDSTTVRSVK